MAQQIIQQMRLKYRGAMDLIFDSFVRLLNVMKMQQNLWPLMILWEQEN